MVMFDVEGMVSPGFTLVEVTLVLGIIATLVILAFLGQGEIRARARLTDAVDRTVVTLSKAQSDANTTRNDSSDPATRGTDDTQVFFGELVKFTGGSSDVTITPLWHGDSDCVASGDPGCTLSTPDPVTTFEIPNGVKPKLSTTAVSVVFARDRSTGRPETYPLDGNLADPEILDFSNYDGGNILAKLTIELDDGRNHCADITVDATNPSNGVINRAYVACH